MGRAIERRTAPLASGAELSIMAAFAEFERELIRERTREGIARARAEGKPVGKRGPDKKPRRRRRAA